jgi:GNAT superfamily N-acetyltransferase
MTASATARPVRARHAEPGDARALWQLMQQLAGFEGYAAQFKVTERDVLERGLGPAATRQFTAIVAEVPSGELVGHAVTYAIPFTYDLRPTLVLKELFVIEARRSTGAGTALMQAVLSQAHATSCGRLRWQVLPSNRRAQAFYRRFGGAPDGQWDSWILEIDA